MKIILVNTLYYPYRVGGAEISVQLLAEELYKLGHSVKVLCLHPENNIKEDTINGVQVVYLPLKNIYWPFSSAVEKRSRLKKLIWHLKDYYNLAMGKMVDEELKKFNPDVVHTNNLSGFSPYIWNIIKKRKIRLIHTTRDFYLFFPNASLFKNNQNINPNKFVVKIWSFFRKKMSNQVDCYIGISHFMMDFHVNNGFFNRSKIKSYIYNTIDVNHTCMTKLEEIKTIGYIGRINTEKGFDTFCNLSRRSLSSDKNYRFIAAGSFDNSYDSIRLQNMAKSSSVELLGYVDIESFLNNVDVIVFPIRWKEPFGRVVVECILAGKVVISNPLGGVTELKEIIPNLYFMNEVITPEGWIDFNKIKIINITENHKQFFSKDSIAYQYITFFKDK